jgi:hypothetical protein
MAHALARPVVSSSDPVLRRSNLRWCLQQREVWPVHVDHVHPLRI